MMPIRMSARFLQHPRHTLRGVRQASLSRLFLDLEMLIHAGIPLMDALYELAATADADLRAVLGHVLAEIQTGRSLSQAMAQHPNVFDAICVSLVRAGEESGCLERVCGRIGLMLKWRAELAVQARAVLTYPALLATMLLGVILFLLLYLVPQLSDFMRSSGQALPFSTRMLLGMSNGLREVWPLLLMVPISLGLSSRWVRSHPYWRIRLDDWKLRVWLVGPILKKLMLARLTGTYAMLFASGIGVLDCLGFLRGVAANRVVERALQAVIRDVESGLGLEQSFRRTGLFPPLVLRMVRLGENTGNLDQCLSAAAEWLERDARIGISRVQALTEPTLTLLLGLVLGWVILSVLLPIYDVISKVPL